VPTAVSDQGSNLADPANLARQSPEDWAAWIITEVFGIPRGTRQTAGSGSAAITTPGQILWFDVKGMALPSHPGAPPPSTINGGTAIHLVDLVPQPDGRVLVDHASGAFHLPDTGDPQQITRFFPENFCVKPGDYVGFSSEGGFDPGSYQHGVPLQIFSQVSGWTLDYYSKHNDIMNGHRFFGAPQQNVELLMHEKEGTGGFATPLCPGGTAGTPQGADPLTTLDQNVGNDGTLGFVFVVGTGDTVSGKATVGGAHGATVGSIGPAAVAARGRVFGRGSVTADRTGPVTLGIKPTRRGARIFKRRSTISVTVHLSFRSSASLGSTAKTKDFRLKIHGKGKKKH
jgi:hypothetical protein